MRRAPAVGVLLLVMVLVPRAISAQSAQSVSSQSVPRLINISGVFRPADGLPAAPVETVTLSIYADAEGGAPLWQETQTIAIDAQGRYSLLLGATRPEGIPAAVFSGEATRWLGTVVERVGEVEGPRKRLTSVPYAIRAADADTLGGRPASAYLLAPNARGTTTGQSADIGSGESTADIVQPGTPNFLAKYVNGTDVGNSGVFEAVGGAIGLGTTTPFDRLHVRYDNNTGDFTGLAVQNMNPGALAYSGMLFYDHSGALTQFQGYNNSTHEYRINNIARVSPGGAFNGSINFMIGGSSRFFVGSNGGIGIGTTAPFGAFEVSNGLSGLLAANVAATTYGANNFGSIIYGRKARGTSGAPSAALINDPLAFFAGRGYATSNFGTALSGMTVRAAENFTDTAQGTFLQFSTIATGTTQSVNAMTIASNGNVGIGVGFPFAALDMVRETPNALDINLTRYAGTSTSGEPNIALRTARGTRAAPSPVQFGDELGGVFATGYGATDFGGGGAGFGAFAAENWTDTAQGAALGLAATPLGSNEAQVNLAILPGGNVGIGAFSDFPTITDRLHVFGDLRVGTSGTNGCIKDFGGNALAGICSSDRRFKQDIRPFDHVLDRVTALRPVHYFWRAAEFPGRQFGDRRAYGLIAQDVEQILPELVVTNDDGFKAVDYSALPLLTVQAVKDLRAENDALKQRLAELERRVNELLASAPRR